MVFSTLYSNRSFRISIKMDIRNQTGADVKLHNEAKGYSVSIDWENWTNIKIPPALHLILINAVAAAAPFRLQDWECV